jgi:tRNA uridine 5-carboxymethylaminomethyl modification enzyme
LAERLGLLEEDELRTAEQRLSKEDAILAEARQLPLDVASANDVLVVSGSAPVSETQRVADLARRPGVPIDSLFRAAGVEVVDEECRWADIELKYEGYLAREHASARRMSELNDFVLPQMLAYRSFLTLSYEAREKLHRIRPASLGHASRIPGVSPSDLQNLVIEVLRLRRAPEERRCFT